MTRTLLLLGGAALFALIYTFMVFTDVFPVSGIGKVYLMVGGLVLAVTITALALRQSPKR